MYKTATAYTYSYSYISRDPSLKWNVTFTNGEPIHLYSFSQCIAILSKCRLSIFKRVILTSVIHTMTQPKGSMYRKGRNPKHKYTTLRQY